ncbi:uncharacterized protein BDZ83DRAFT_366999 [Colletotrichum acutatum]|uniref:Uncharacterized protein n=1 Tax=Glomerella acutata TaxID=27357 RepID=A0AAD8UJG2_GLOAC|nr:uncharacterized protein BDZ83DRAFT_366999 [Colletotrichum acutatum]KAK1723907.1 hypothetical protein BDZ83DRAFT_366999 [Colletotrichum acutatum]
MGFKKLSVVLVSASHPTILAGAWLVRPTASVSTLGTMMSRIEGRAAVELLDIWVLGTGVCIERQAVGSW